MEEVWRAMSCEQSYTTQSGIETLEMWIKILNEVEIQRISLRKHTLWSAMTDRFYQRGRMSIIFILLPKSKPCWIQTYSFVSKGCSFRAIGTISFSCMFPWECFTPRTNIGWWLPAPKIPLSLGQGQGQLTSGPGRTYLSSVEPVKSSCSARHLVDVVGV